MHGRKKTYSKFARDLSRCGIVVRNNLIGGARTCGTGQVDGDLVVDGGLVTARAGAQCRQFARKIIEMLSRDE